WLQTNGLLAEVERAEISGEVRLNGEPVRWGTITFEPLDRSQAPIAGGRIAGGKYKLPASTGIVLGMNQVIVRSLGSIDPIPTIDEVLTVTGQGTLAGVVTFEAKPGENRLDLNIETLSLPDVKTAPMMR
ncbi:MAG: hypothetical protein KF861_23705, partial [Planctomycetaceae bacterium]|nr:hypothetical protein [Planctomycetaceae bacterium]